jgi:hypothetical protein
MEIEVLLDSYQRKITLHQAALARGRLSDSQRAFALDGIVVYREAIAILLGP